MFIQFHDLIQMNTKSALQITDNGRILLALRLKPGLRSLQGFPVFIQFLLDLLVFLVETKIFVSELGSISGV